MTGSQDSSRTGQEKQPHDDIKRTLSLVAKVTLELAGLVQLVTWLVLTDYIITTSNQPSLDVLVGICKWFQSQIREL